MNEIVMPKLSDTMTEGRLVSWKKRVGESVSRGEVIAEVETDKANMELESFVSGVLVEIRVEAGEEAQVGTVIAVIGGAGEQVVPETKPAAAGVPVAEPAREKLATPEPPKRLEKPEPEPPEAPVAAAAAPSAAPSAGEERPPTASGSGEVRVPAASAGVVGREGAPAPPPEAVLARAAPVVRRRARELGVNLDEMSGSGPDGRILLQDLDGPGVAHGANAPVAVAGGVPTGEAEPLSRLRSAIARTVYESWTTIPHFQVTMEIVMDEAESLRRQLKSSGMPVTLNDLVVKGVSLSLQKFPYLNASFAANGITLHGDINIGVAVGVADGVLVPVIAGCQLLSLPEISRVGRSLVEKARSGSLNPQEMSGGTFSVSNLGMYGIDQFSAIIYPSQAAVLAVGAVLDQVVVRAGMPACARLMKVTLSADHRLIDGAYAAQFLDELKGVLESPLRLVI